MNTNVGVAASWEEMRERYPMERDEMTVEQETQFVNECFNLYEQEGFSPQFWSPFTDNQERVGLPVEIVGRIEADMSHDLGVLPMWKARLNGEEFEVFPEEVIPSEMKANGCRWFDDILLYDSSANERFSGLPVDVMSPQEMADATGKAVKDGSQYYLPNDMVPSVGDIIQDAEARTAKGLPIKEDGGLEIV